MLVVSSVADALTWGPLQGWLEKAAYNVGPGKYKISSAEGIDATFRMTSMGTFPGLFSFRNGKLIDEKMLMAWHWQRLLGR